MSFVAALTSAEVLAAGCVLALIALAELPLGYCLKRRFESSRVFHWGWDRIAAPLLHALAIALFVLLAYPALYGLRSAPAIGVLLEAAPLRMTQLINALFVASLLLPLLPGLARRPALVLLLQALIATAMVFHWYAAYLGARSAGSWPGLSESMLIAGVALVSYHLGTWSGGALGTRLDTWLHTRGFERVAAPVTALLAQVPTVVCYGYVLGLQLAI